MRKPTIVFVLACAILLATALVCTSNAYSATRTVSPLGNGYGIASIADTAPDPTGAYNTRYPSGSGICSAFPIGAGSYRVNGAIFDFGSIIGGTYSESDVTGFYYTFNPGQPDSLDVWSNVIGKTDATLTNNIRDMGFGGVSGPGGLLSLRMDGFSGGIAGNAIGTLPVDQTATTVFGASYSAPGFTLLGGGTGATSAWTVGPIGENQDMVVSSSFAKYLGRFRGNFASGGGYLSPHGQYLTATNTDGRGSPAINDVCRVIAAATQKEAGDPTPNYGEWFRLRVINYTDDGSANGYSQVSQNTYYFRTIPGDNRTFAFANYYSRSAYGGPQQISINDHGDIAFPVVIDVAGNPPPSTDDSPYRVAKRRGILFMSHLTPGQFKVVLDNHEAQPLVMYDPRSTGTYYAPCIGGVAIDNDCNIYFSAANWMGYWNDGTKTTSVIYKASADNASNPAYWNAEPIFWRGCAWKDGAATCEATILPLGNSGAEFYANTAAFCSTGINRTTLPGKTDPRYSVGGLLLGAGLSITNVSGNTMRALYLTPTDQTPAASNINKAKQLADNEPVNLNNCVITAIADPYTVTIADLPAILTYYRYVVSDASRSRIVVSTIRNTRTSGDPLGLGVGDRICVSGTIETNGDPDDTSMRLGDRYISSGGVVLLASDAAPSTPVAMLGRSVGSGGGINTLGMWVRVFGKITALDTTAKTMDIHDGSGSSVRVIYGGNKLPAGATVGSYVSASGDITSELPAVITMRGPDSESGNAQDSIVRH